MEMAIGQTEIRRKIHRTPTRSHQLSKTTIGHQLTPTHLIHLNRNHNHIPASRPNTSRVPASIPDTAAKLKPANLKTQGRNTKLRPCVFWDPHHVRASR